MFREESTLKNDINMFPKVFRNIDTSVFCISVKGATLTQSYFCLRHKNRRKQKQHFKLLFSKLI